MSKKIYIGESKIRNAGRGVFASMNMRKNTVIEICPTIIMSAKDNDQIVKTALQHYVFEHNTTGAMLALGFGSLYNHHVAPNAKYELMEAEDGGNPELCITAIKTIAKDEEICINYGTHFDQKYGLQ